MAAQDGFPPSRGLHSMTAVGDTLYTFGGAPSPPFCQEQTRVLDHRAAGLLKTNGRRTLTQYLQLYHHWLPPQQAWLPLQQADGPFGWLPHLKLVLPAGAPKNGPMLNDVYALDTAADSLAWRPLNPGGQAPHVRCSHSAVAVGTDIVFHGGSYYR